jgi:hypothetical protein
MISLIVIVFNALHDSLNKVFGILVIVETDNIFPYPLISFDFTLGLRMAGLADN